MTLDAKSESTDDRDLTWGMVGGLWASILGIIAIAIFCLIERDALFSLLAFAGAVAGWLIGILAAPIDKQEEERFGVFIKVISGFITGYMLSKVDPVITALFTIDHNTGLAPIADKQIAMRSLITLCSFGVSLLTVFCARAYWLARKV